MSPIALRIVALAVALIVAAVAFLGPAPAPGGGAYEATVKVISGAVAIVGSLYLARAIGLTLLRSGGAPAFTAAYVTAVALGGLGAAEAASAARPGNVGHAMAACCIVSTISGVLWVRFYGRHG